MTIRPYHAALASRISALAIIKTSMDLGRAAGFAELGQVAFVPPTERHDVIEAFTELKGRVSKASLKTVDKNKVLAAIDNAVELIKVQPAKLVSTNGAGDGGHVPNSQHDTDRHART